MHFPKSAVLIASIQGLAAFTAATSFAKYPRAAGGAAITSTTAEKAVSMQDVPSCAEIFAIHPNHTDTLQRTTCYTTAISIEEAQAKEVTARSADNTVYGPYCDNTGYAAGAIDATTLCQSIPSGWTLPPAYGSGSCACETWSIGSAAFAFSSAIVFATIAFRDAGIVGILRHIIPTPFGLCMAMAVRTLLLSILPAIRRIISGRLNSVKRTGKGTKVCRV
ncbi:hypothetical protein BDZ45DRAFT_694013 [Acephala macrosclerotiorum]|nr:hypothetical protein BDZ45DRAFT_694013 [Acephala macrosclerotiorum]